MGPAHKQQFSAFTGIADIRKDAGRGQATIVAGAEIYVSDFGELVAIPHPYGLTRDAPIVDPAMVSVAVLDGYKTPKSAERPVDSSRLQPSVARAKGRNSQYFLTFLHSLPAPRPSAFQIRGHR